MSFREILGKKTAHQNKHAEREFYQLPLEAITNATEEGYHGRFDNVNLRTIKYFPKNHPLLEMIVSKTPVMNMFDHKVLIKAVK